MSETQGAAEARVAALVGSLRRGSYNRTLLRAAIELQPAGMRIEEVPLDALPFFNEDLEAAEPEAVTRFKRTIAAADAVLFVTAEYNYSLPGLLKNAIDWGSRPTGRGALQGKVAAVMGASWGPVGTRRAQLHLRQIGTYLDLKIVNKPEVVVSLFEQKMDGDGRLADEATREQVRQLLVNLLDWTRRFSLAL